LQNLEHAAEMLHDFFTPPEKFIRFLRDRTKFAHSSQSYPPRNLAAMERPQQPHNSQTPCKTLDTSLQYSMNFLRHGKNLFDFYITFLIVTASVVVPPSAVSGT
jgi:hypothetical protein